MACNFAGCSRPVDSLGLCNAHYGQRYRGESLRALRPRRRKTDPQEHCLLSTCELTATTKGWCSAHYWVAYKYFAGDNASAAAWLEKHPVCEVCGADQDLVVDHDHRHCPYRSGCPKCVRGRLCRKCNTLEGLVAGDVGILSALRQYIENNA